MNRQKIKSHLIILSGFCYYFNQIKKINNSNYFSWTANLGVVPLFLFEAFLFAPEVFFLAALLFLVTLVLETILTLPLADHFFQKYKFHFLPIFSSSVKAFPKFCNSHSALTLCTLSFLVTPQMQLMAKDTYAKQSESYSLTIGEILELKLEKNSLYSVTNKSNIKYQFTSHKNLLTVKALKLGSTEIKVHPKNGASYTIAIQIIQKSLEQKLNGIEKILREKGFKTLLTPPYIEVTGDISTPKQFYWLSKIFEEHQNNIQVDLEINKDILKKIFANIYQDFLNNHYDFIKCHLTNYKILCVHPENLQLNDKYKNYLKKEYNIDFYENKNFALENYQVKLKILQLEQTDGRDMKLGFDQLQGSLSDFFHSSLENIIGKNEVILKENHIHLSTLAFPQFQTTLKEESMIQLGSEVPVTINNKGRNMVQWKFSGLKIKIKLDEYLNKLKVQYETELTKPTGDTSGGVAGNIGKSNVMISLNKPIKIFDISLKTDGKTIDQLPYLSNIPLIGEIFKSKSQSENFKTIIGFIEITKI